MSKTEGAFNSFLASEFQKYRPRFYAIKLADKYKAGISDFLIFCDGKGIALESKNILTRGSSGLLLKHPFSPQQRNFFRNVDGTRNFAMGILGIDDEKKMFLIHPSIITENGNIPRERLDGCHRFDRTSKGVEELVRFFGGLDA